MHVLQIIADILQTNAYDLLMIYIFFYQMQLFYKGTNMIYGQKQFLNAHECTFYWININILRTNANVLRMNANDLQTNVNI